MYVHYPYYRYQYNQRGQLNQHRNSSFLIVVEGNGTVKVKPDIVTIRVGVMTRDEDAKNAQNQNQLKTNALINALIKNGIEKENIETVTYQVAPYFQYPPNAEKILKGYEVTHLLAVTIKDVEKAGLVYDVAFNNGGNLADNPTFSVQNEQMYQIEALRLAVLNAGEKANVIGETIGVTISPTPKKVKEVSTTFRPIHQPMYELAVKTVSSTPIQARDVEFQATVEVEYLSKA
ncbi:SIMPL domain-containing protein [Bacillus timonensis]|nr:SIMPL domain-containing protein [Bacillus timonensis]